MKRTGKKDEGGSELKEMKARREVKMKETEYYGNAKREKIKGWCMKQSR